MALRPEWEKTIDKAVDHVDRLHQFSASCTCGWSRPGPMSLRECVEQMVLHRILCVDSKLLYGEDRSD